LVKLLKSPAHLLTLRRNRTHAFAYLCKKGFGKCLCSIHAHIYFYVRIQLHNQLCVCPRWFTLWGVVALSH